MNDYASCLEGRHDECPQPPRGPLELPWSGCPCACHLPGNDQQRKEDTRG